MESDPGTRMKQVDLQPEFFFNSRVKKPQNVLGVNLYTAGISGFPVIFSGAMVCFRPCKLYGVSIDLVCYPSKHGPNAQMQVNKISHKFIRDWTIFVTCDFSNQT